MKPTDLKPLQEDIDRNWTHFDGGAVFLDSRKLDMLKKFVYLIEPDPTTTKEITYYRMRRAHEILSNFWRDSPCLFVLLALTTSPSMLGEVPPRQEAELVRWWSLRPDEPHPLRDMIAEAQTPRRFLENLESTLRTVRSGGGAALATFDNTVTVSGTPAILNLEPRVLFRFLEAKNKTARMVVRYPRVGEGNVNARIRLDEESVAEISIPRSFCHDLFDYAASQEGSKVIFASNYPL